MGRPVKNVNHPLARLRRQLSYDGHQMTRRELSKRAGIPERTLQDCEAGKFKLGIEAAIQISLVTPVDPESLMRGDDPLLDAFGEAVEHQEGANIDFPLDSPHGSAREVLFKTLWEAAMAKNRSLALSYSFDQWVETTMQLLDLEACFLERLTLKLREALFDPDEIPFRPENPNVAKQWKNAEQQIRREQVGIFKERLEQLQKEGKHLIDESDVDEELMLARQKAIKNLRQRKSNAVR
jgi:hypothetical protein